MVFFLRKNKTPEKLVKQYEATPDDDLINLFYDAMESVEEKQEEARKKYEE